MGTINVKISNNYETDPYIAAGNYSTENFTEKHRANKIVPGSWVINPDVELNVGFGAIAQTTDGKFHGFAVCFLWNQCTGFTTEYKDYLDYSSSPAGGEVISTEYYDWWQKVAQFIKIDQVTGDPDTPSITELGMFTHPAYLMVSHLNDLSMQDEFTIDFEYPSPIFPGQPNHYTATQPDIADPDWYGTKRVRTSQRVNGIKVPGGNKFYQTGAYGDNPWPKCNMRSFHSSQTVTAGDTFEDVKNEQTAFLTSCGKAQDEKWIEQWNEINAEPGPAAS